MPKQINYGLPRGANILSNGLRVNCDGTTIKTRKRDLKLMSNHFKRPILPKRIWHSFHQGTAVRDGNGWYKKEEKEE